MFLLQQTVRGLSEAEISDLKITTDWFRSWPRAHLCTAEGVYIFGDLIISGFRLLIRISTTSRSSPERSRAMSR